MLGTVYRMLVLTLGEPVSTLCENSVSKSARFSWFNANVLILVPPKALRMALNQENRADFDTEFSHKVLSKGITDQNLPVVAGFLPD